MRRPSGIALATFIAICVIVVLSFISVSNVLGKVGGTATWYCGNGSPCTKGYGPSDLVAAIDRKDSPYRKGDRVVVRRGSRHVTVTIVDTCACGGSRIIDLTTGAFRRLAPLSRGEISVTLEGAAARVAPPPTDTSHVTSWRGPLSYVEVLLFWATALTAYAGWTLYLRRRMG